MYFVLLMTALFSASAEPDIVSFCRAHPTLDYPNTVYSGKAHAVPEQVTATGATNWRCMDGQVLMCLNSADGGACSPKDPGTKPNPVIRQICLAQPGLDFIPTYASGYSASTWRCNAHVPAIIHSVPLDKRGFMQGAWTHYVIKDGVVQEPHDDFGGDPR